MSDLDFAAERRLEAEQVLLLLRGLAAGKPFPGTFLMPGQPVVLIGSTPGMTSRAFADGIKASSMYWGATIGELGSMNALDEPLSLMSGLQEPVDTSKMVAFGMDVVQVVAPITEDIADASDPRTVIEACAEVIRVLLAGAIIAAKDELPEGDEVMAYFRALRFEVFPDFESNTIFVAGRLRASVHRKSDPAKSYILGGGSLDYKLDDARMFCGDTRLRFLDLRSPGHNVHEELVRVTA